MFVNELMVLSTTSSGLDTQWVTDFLGVVKSVIGICSEFPLNFLLTASLVISAVFVFRGLKRALMPH